MRANGVEYRAFAGYAVAVVVGVSIALWMFTWASIVGDGSISNPPPDDDRAQHIIGQRYFIADAWRWPLLQAHALVPPGGTNIAFTDSIPIIALGAKLASKALPRDFQATSLWLALSWAALPIAGVFALRAAGERQVLAAFAISVIGVSLPTLFWRTGHEALSSHFLIVIALGLYFKMVSRARCLHYVGAGILMLVALLVHPYILVMVASLLCAAPTSLMLSTTGSWPAGRAVRDAECEKGMTPRDGREWLRVGSGLAVGMVITAAVAMLLGYTQVSSAAGFGYYSMNLVSPFYPMGSALIPVSRVIDATGGQYEGYQYLGLGVLMLCFVGGIYTCRPNGLGWAGRHWGLIAVCVCLFLFSLSNRVYIADRLLVSVNMEVPQLRATGRFFWPVAYTVLVGSVVATRRVIPAPYSYVVLMCAALLQFVDVGGMRSAVYSDQRGQAQWVIAVDELRDLMKMHRTLTIWPPWPCLSEGMSRSLMQILLVASETAIPVNTMYVARSWEGNDCTSTAEDYRKPLVKGELRVLLPGVGDGVRSALADWGPVCRKAGNLIVCSRT